jgi:uncharacterized membrane protein
MAVSKRQNITRGEKWQLRKQKKGKVRNTRERMDGCKCKIEMNKDVQVLINEDKKEIIFQSNSSSSRYKKVK